MKKRKQSKNTSKKTNATNRVATVVTVVVAVSLVICSFFFDLWLYHALTKQPAEGESQSFPIIQTGKTIYLTFDMDMDGTMYQKYREKIVAEWYDPALFIYLTENHIPATFFVSGLFIQAYPALLRNLASDENFSFQNHSYDESSFVPDCYWLATLSTDQEKINQIEVTEDLIKEMTGQKATYFRFPGICHDPYDDALVERQGLSINDGTIVSGDPFNNNVATMVRTVMSQAKNNSIIIMHVGGPNAPESPTLLERIVPLLEQQGYSFAKLPNP